MSEGLILRPKASHRVEIVRSYSFKLNCELYGGPKYESRDFFCSERSECAIEDAEEVSAALFSFCRREVLKSVAECIREMQRRKEAA